MDWIKMNIEVYSTFQIDRACRLDRVDQAFQKWNRILSNYPQTEAILPLIPYQTLDGEMKLYQINRQFLFGVFLVRRSLVKDLEDNAGLDIAEDIIAENSRLVLPVFK